MNINYLYNLIDLYLKNENDTKKAKLSFTKGDEEVCIRMGMIDSEEKTIFRLPKEMIDDNLAHLLQKYKNSSLVIDEKYEYDGDKDYCYQVKFNKGRILIFNHFTLQEVNHIRNTLYGISINQEEIRIPKEEQEEKKLVYHYKSFLPQMGFSSYKAILITSLSVMITFLLSLFVFYLLTK